MKVQTIKIERVEGFTEDLMEVTLKTFEAANKTVSMMAKTAPDDGSYDKADFLITWEDGQEYRGRVDLTKSMTYGYNFLEQITHNVEYMAKMKAITTKESIDFIDKYIGYDFV